MHVAGSPLPPLSPAHSIFHLLLQKGKRYEQHDNHSKQTTTSGSLCFRSFLLPGKGVIISPYDLWERISETALSMKIYSSWIPFTNKANEYNISTMYTCTLIAKSKPYPARNFSSYKTKKQQQQWHLWHSKHEAKPFSSLNLQTALRVSANITFHVTGEKKKQKNSPKSLS